MGVRRSAAEARLQDHLRHARRPPVQPSQAVPRGQGLQPRRAGQHQPRGHHHRPLARSGPGPGHGRRRRSRGRARLQVPARWRSLWGRSLRRGFANAPCPRWL